MTPPIIIMIEIYRNNIIKSSPDPHLTRKVLFDYQEMNKTNQLLPKFYKLDDEGQETVFRLLSALEITNLDKERRKKLKEI